MAILSRVRDDFVSYNTDYCHGNSKVYITYWLSIHYFAYHLDSKMYTDL
jgi:hypothetical protein